ncbi:MAG: sodium:glutamate symporter [Firmicutes bacterium]|nr:sodium:glutamate symporter [Bacillota bacterium]HOB35322.1 sodium:glutamate symporter [Bacillota bacterium]HPZ91279.1 sodium:glutamate symporter [Bacillota bacterium]HQE02657.1 sodium:glutamate symporter [Bacillota bacterium]
MDFSASNQALWNLMLQFGIMAGLMLFANVLRRKIPLFRKSLLPTAVLAGFIALFVRMSGALPIDAGLMEMVTYHSIAIGFIALSLQIPDKKKKAESAGLIAARSGALIVSTYLLQGLLGLAVSVGMAYTIMPNLFKAAGILLPMGYGQGPGQANNVGSTYEALGFAGGQSFGLSLAAAGFLCACTVGVIYINIMKRQGKIDPSVLEPAARPVTVADFQSHNEIPISESVDRLSVQFSLVIIVYLGTYLVSRGITALLAAYLPGLSATLSSLVWGFNFIIGALLAIICRNLFAFLTRTGLMTRQYPNNYLLSRIAGVAFDFMVLAGIAAIDMRDLAGLWLPFALMAVLGGAVTLWYLAWICKKLYPGYYYEGMLSMFGMLTGTISSGVLLLREIDPSFRTPAAVNLLTGSSFAILFGLPMLVLIGLAPQSVAMLFTAIAIMVVYFALLLYFMLAPKLRKS